MDFKLQFSIGNSLLHSSTENEIEFMMFAQFMAIMSDVHLMSYSLFSISIRNRFTRIRPLRLLITLFGYVFVPFSF